MREELFQFNPETLLISKTNVAISRLTNLNITDLIKWHQDFSSFAIA
jgi:hypothetical protein